MTIEDLYAEKCRTPSDISPLLPTLRQFADECDVVVEFGVRHGFSTTAFLASKCTRVISYDLNRPSVTLPPTEAAKWGFVEADTSRIETNDIPVCDLLFIDTLHTQAQVREELRHHMCVKKYIAFHDTMLFGLKDEGSDGHGVLSAVFDFLVDHPEFSVCYWTVRSNGLLILKRTTYPNVWRGE